MISQEQNFRYVQSKTWTAPDSSSCLRRPESHFPWIPCLKSPGPASGCCVRRIKLKRRVALCKIVFKDYNVHHNQKMCSMECDSFYSSGSVVMHLVG